MILDACCRNIFFLVYTCSALAESTNAASVGIFDVKAGRVPQGLVPESWSWGLCSLCIEDSVGRRKQRTMMLSDCKALEHDYV